MPPTQKFNKEDILKAAFRLVQEQGFEKLNARNIAKILNSSTRPIYSYYKNMADLKADLFIMVSNYNGSFFDRLKIDKDLLANIGMIYIDFAIEEPNLFRMMFMTNSVSGVKLINFFSYIGDNCNKNLEKALSGAYDMKSEKTKNMLIDLWIYSHGIASMLATNQLPTPRNEIEAMLKNMCNLLSKQAKRK